MIEETSSKRSGTARPRLWSLRCDKALSSLSFWTCKARWESLSGILAPSEALDLDPMLYRLLRCIFSPPISFNVP
ncbi:hypothetical protein V6N13_082366 [Hibiscus sabdariffa]